MIAHYTHCIFTTYQRHDLIDENMQPNLWAFMGGIARKRDITAHAIGGTANHVHLLLSIPPELSLSKAMQILKSGSSKWMNDSYFPDRRIRWQQKYGAFSVSPTGVDRVVDYIHRQPEHHRKMSFEEEVRLLAKKFNLEADEQGVFK